MNRFLKKIKHKNIKNDSYTTKKITDSYPSNYIVNIIISVFSILRKKRLP